MEVRVMLLHVILIVICVVAWAIGIVLVSIFDFGKSPGRSFGQFIGILLVFVCPPWLYSLAIDPSTHALLYNAQSSPNYSTYSAITVVSFSGKDVKWKAQSGMLWVAIQAPKQGEKEREPFIINAAAESFSHDELEKVPYVNVWYGTATGPGSFVKVENSALKKPPAP